MEKINGRPTKYRHEYDDVALEFIGVQGRCVAELARELRVSKQTIYDWAKKHPSFLDALTHAKDWSEGYWMEQMASMMQDRNVNAPLVKLYMSSRFGMTDRDGGQDKAAESETSQLEQQIAKASERLWDCDDD